MFEIVQWQVMFLFSFYFMLFYFLFINISSVLGTRLRNGLKINSLQCNQGLH